MIERKYTDGTDTEGNAESICSQKFNSTAEIMEGMKEMLRDMLQQVVESELECVG